MDFVASWFSGGGGGNRSGDESSDATQSESEDEATDDRRRRSKPVDSSTASEAEEEDEDAEAKALLPPATILHSYDEVRRAIEDGARAEDYPSGLTNGGNTCFAAAALQCLRRASALTSWFEDVSKFHDAFNCEKSGKFCVVCEYAEHLERAKTSRDAHSIGRLTRDINKVARQFKRGRQEDSHEFITALLDAMHVVFLKELGGEKKYDLRTQETTAIYHVFGGYTLGTVKCMSCGHVSKNFQSTLDIPLEVSGKIGSVEEALEENYCTEETLQGSNKYRCSKCKALVRAKKGSKIHVSPNVLMIPLKRYSTGRFSKITKYVSYPSTFSLGPFMSDDAPYEVTPPNYHLFGVLVHQDFYASAHSGHYIAYVKLEDGSWVLCNDSRITPSSEKEAMKQKAYILFYERAEPRGAPRVRPPGYLEELKSAREMQTPPKSNGSTTTTTLVRDEHLSPSSERKPTVLTEDLSRKLQAMRVKETTTSSPSPPGRAVPATNGRSKKSRASGVDKEERSVTVETGSKTLRLPYRFENVAADDGTELKMTVTLEGCSSVENFSVEFISSPDQNKYTLRITAPGIYEQPVEINLPENIIDEPTRSTFKKATSRYCVRFPLKPN